MSDSESLDYLQPGFEARSLTVPRLRSILVAHNVHYPSTAKKADLIALFNDNVVPQSKKILERRARAKRSSKGIVDAESTSSSNPFDEIDDLAPPTRTRTTRSRSPRKRSTRIKSEEVEDGMPAPRVRSTSKRVSRASSRQPEVTDTDTNPETEGTGTVRRGRRTPQPRAQPQFKQEDTDEHFFRRTSEAFTADNPFQSGSSPAVPEKTPLNCRRTAGHENVRPTSSSRRRTEGPTYVADERSSPAQTFETPATHFLRGQKTPYTPATPVSEPKPEKQLAVEAGEEFTPEEQLELVADEAVDGEGAVVPTRQTRPARKSHVGSSLTVMLVTLLSVYAGWYRQEKIAIGYCGVGRTSSSIPSEIPVPEWAQQALGPEISIPPSVAEALEPKCEPCPSHAYCFGDFSVRCEQDYILKPHPLSLGGLVPLPPTCEPDSEKVRRIQAVADRAVEELRERTAKFECGELTNEEGEKLESPAIEEQELKEIINQKRSKKMSDQEFDDLWGSAIGEIKAREEVEVEAKEDPDADSGAVPATLLTSTSLARIPLTCAVRRSIRLGLARYRLQISALISLILTVLYGRSRYLSNRAAAAQVPALVDLVLERLANQKQFADEEDDPYLFLPNLRDDVLRTMHSLSQREKIWQRVRAVVEQNSNVRTSQREGRSGEVGRAWEWIGPVAGESAARRRRRSGRDSWGPQSAPGSEIKDEGDSSEMEKSYLHQKWEESRPIY